MIRCKFVVSSKTQHAYGGEELAASPVYQGEEGSENAKFWEATPSGTLELSGVKNGSLEGLKPGQEFYLDLTPIPAAE